MDARSGTSGYVDRVNRKVKACKPRKLEAGESIAFQPVANGPCFRDERLTDALIDRSTKSG